MHVRGASDFYQSFFCLYPDRTWIAIFRVPGRSLHWSRPSRTRGKKKPTRGDAHVLGALDLTDGRKEETDTHSATTEALVSFPEGKKIPVAEDADVSDVLSTLLYGSETWTTYQRHIKRSNHFHTIGQKKILGITWQKQIPETEVLTMASLLCICMQSELR